MKAQADLESKNESTGRDCESCVVLEADHRKRVRKSGSKRATSEVKKKKSSGCEVEKVRVDDKIKNAEKLCLRKS